MPAHLAAEAPRASGLAEVGAIPWGTHFCQFYRTSDDLLDLVVPYLGAGLARREQCLWITAEPVHVDEAWAALARAVPDLEERRRCRQVEILSHRDWYLQGGRFDAARVLAGWVEKLEQGLARGFEGLRLTGDTLWLESDHWSAFTEYEDSVDRALSLHPMLALCTYSLERCRTAEINDVLANHEFALLKERGAWQRVDSQPRRWKREARERRRQQADLLRLSNDAILVSRLGGGLEAWNRGAEELYGYPEAEALGRFPGELLATRYPDDWARAEARLADGGEWQGELRQRARDGRELVVSSRLQILRGDDGVARVLEVDRDVTEEHRAREAQREAARRKDEFLAVLSHELRNPLTPIRNSLYVLDRAAPGGEQARRATAVIGRQVDHLSHLVDDLLDVTRIQRGKIRLHRERLDLVELLRQTADDYRGLLCEHRFSVVLPEGPVGVDGDRTRIAQAVGNLLGNAAKFTPAGGEVTLRLTAEGTSATLEIADTGVGLDAATRARLFEPFAQADRSLDRSQGGLGLGLALVRGFVELHGGEVSAYSDGPSAGARFVVRLPLAEAPRTRAAPATQPRAGAGAGRRVLVIEDNRDAADSLAEALALLGYDVQVAYSGQEGLELARGGRPELIVCDIGLPDRLDGYAVAGALRQDPALRSAFLVALTGYAQPEDEQRALRAGFDVHLAKPPDLNLLERLLAQAAA